MIRFIILLFLIILSNNVLGQEVIFHELDSKLNKRYEFSSIRIRKDSIFLMPENYNKLFICDLNSPNTKKKIGSIDIEYSNSKQEKEGTAIFKNLLFFTDETDNTIHLEELNTNVQWKINPKFTRQQCDEGKCGFEGIEISADGDYLYVLREKSSKRDKISYIYCFNIKYDFDKKICSLKLDKKIEIILPNKKQRYSDLTLSGDMKSIYLIRSEPKKYYIDNIRLNQEGKFDRLLYKSKNLEFKNISSDLNKKWNEGYNNNIEGITVYKNSIFLVSDNCMGKGGKGNKCYYKNPNPPLRKTMLIEIKL